MSDNNGMKNLVLTINKLQETFKNLNVHMDIDLPQIAVVGIQSSGKSSVLEKFIGRDFLPRGSGIVTRRPLILQLITHTDEYAKFDHTEEVFRNFEKVQKEITQETDRVVGTNKGVSNIPIVLKVFSPNVLNLTLIDLPGMTKVPIGDQPQDIEHRIRSMILDFIKKETCLILAVTPATMDLANSEALKLAREVDPNGNRTIGVITKLDLMDKGTDAVEVLENRQLPLKRGYVGVVNRSQKDIDDKKDIKIAAKAELEFFKTHPSYRHLADRMGTDYLQRVLNKQLSEHILQNLPALREKLRKLHISLEMEFKSTEVTSNVRLLNEIISKFKLDFRGELDGYGGSVTKSNELTSGTEINRIYNEELRNEDFNLNFDEDSFREEVAMTIRNTNGMYSNIFIPEKAFDKVVVTFISKMKEPCQKYVSKISSILQNNIISHTEKLSGHPELREELRKLIISYIIERESLCKERMIEMIDEEMSYINKLHDDFKMIEEKEEAVESTGDEIERKFTHIGYLYLTTGRLSRAEKFWFVLTSNSLSWYKDDTEKEVEGFVLLGNLRIADHKGLNFRLVDADGKNVFKDISALRITCKTPNEASEWVDMLQSVGVSNLKSSTMRLNGNSPESSLWHVPGVIEPQKEVEKKGLKKITNILKSKHFSSSKTPKNTRINQQVETIKNLVINYLEIVVKNAKDRIPKMITWLLITNVLNYMDQNLVAHFYENELVDYVMQKSQYEQQRIEKLQNMYKACKEALKIIDSVYGNMSKIANGAQ
ncbi:dynamin-like [Chironomus tepperi]|uniref:dynamin-like n=1 Tax=Chironomus tepperi TaxID=113505 RepID=UPI00391FA9D6